MKISINYIVMYEDEVVATTPDLRTADVIADLLNKTRKGHVVVPTNPLNLTDGEYYYQVVNYKGVNTLALCVFRDAEELEVRNYHKITLYRTEKEAQAVIDSLKTKN